MKPWSYMASGRFISRPFRPVTAMSHGDLSFELLLFKPSEKQFAKYLSNPHIIEGCSMSKNPASLQVATDTKVCTQVKFGSAK